MVEAHTFVLSIKLFMLEYILVIIGLIVFGDAVLVPTVYLALLGHLNLGLILVLSFLINNSMNVLWYYVGKMKLRGSFRSFSFIEKYEKNHPQIMDMFSKHQLKIIFFSRFLHGSGVSIMILSGIYNVPFKKYMLMNILSSIIVISSIPIIEFWAKTGASTIFNNIKMLEWIVAFIILLIFISIRFELGAFINKILFIKNKTE